MHHRKILKFHQNGAGKIRNPDHTVVQRIYLGYSLSENRSEKKVGLCLACARYDDIEIEVSDAAAY
jgi:hypothetical protein